jgi:hypothetical protein
MCELEPLNAPSLSSSRARRSTGMEYQWAGIPVIRFADQYRSNLAGGKRGEYQSRATEDHDCFRAPYAASFCPVPCPAAWERKKDLARNRY